MSRLEGISAAYRNDEIAKNAYNQQNEYTAGNPDALATGDEKGKGEFNGQIGSATDIKVRQSLIAKNKFNRNKEYNSASA